MRRRTTIRTVRCGIRERMYANTPGGVAYGRRQRTTYAASNHFENTLPTERRMRRLRRFHGLFLRENATTAASNGNDTLDRLNAHLSHLLERHARMTREMSDANASTDSATLIKRGRELKFLNPIADLTAQRSEALQDLEELRVMLEETHPEDEEERELHELMVQDREEKVTEVRRIEEELLGRIVPRDEADECNAVLEVLAGTGGAEASLFTSEIFDMYKSYASANGWSFEILEYSASDQQNGGLVKATASIGSNSYGTAEDDEGGVYGRLKHENGVHRVQRIPATETQGRIHTSAMSVVVLPQPEEIDVELNMAEVRIDTTKASGAGGQHVNTTNSAIRLTHEPTGITVMMQEDRSQHRNKEKAFKLLKARLFERQRAEIEAARQEQRSAVRATGDRSERIRTYNFPTDRITDHRVGLSKFGMEKMLNGEMLSEFVGAMRQREREARLDELLNAESEAG